MHEATAPITTTRRSRRLRTVAASCIFGVLVGAGVTGLIVDDPASGMSREAPAPSTADRRAQEEEAARTWLREELRAAVQRCVLGPSTPEAAQRCLDGLRLEG